MTQQTFNLSTLIAVGSWPATSLYFNSAFLFCCFCQWLSRIGWLNLKLEFMASICNQLDVEHFKACTTHSNIEIEVYMMQKWNLEPCHVHKIFQKFIVKENAFIREFELLSLDLRSSHWKVKPFLAVD